EDAAQRGQVQQVALTRAHRQADIGHQQHDEELQEALSGSWSYAIADHEAEQVGADDPENAADHRPDQPLEADLAKPELEEYDSAAEHEAGCGCGNLRQPERLQFVAGDRNYNDKEDTYKYQVHATPPMAYPGGLR